MELAREEHIELVGVTDASAADARAYAFEQGVGFPILAEASAAMDAFGVGLIWGNVVRLVGPDGTIVAVGRDGAAEALGAR